MKYLLPVLLVSLFAFAGRPQTLPVVDADTMVYDVIRSLGAPERADVMVRPVNGASAEVGERLVVEGLRPKGGKQSAHFTCISCHNIVKEDPVLTDSDPIARLAYAKENNLPFLPATTFWGAVNRETYYNGDYKKKYGDLVKDARRDLRGAIQLCATECAQGAELNAVEMESVVAYLHTLGLKLSDLPDSSVPVDKINAAIDRGGDNSNLIANLKEGYLLASPATFVYPPEDRKAGFPISRERDAANGQAIYQLACLHCHEERKFSFFELGESQFHYDFMTKHFTQYTRYSTYQVSRYGTSPIPGKRAYMPHYTKERMTDGQIEDLRAYLESSATK
ncbi:MAG: mono/diheme cytochrome c family protein [Neolewinella sp.]|jgi:mono/diheme cytochrome c family protein